MIAYSVAQRTRDVGIRRALGAQQSDILQLVLNQGLCLAIIGVTLGIGGALLLTGIVKNLLFHVLLRIQKLDAVGQAAFILGNLGGL